jgi:hypothetical protein
MSFADIIRVAFSKLVKGVPLWQADVPDGKGGQVEGFGEIGVYQALGFSSMPHEATDDGNVEAVVLRNCGGRNAVCIGARDTRNADIVGKLGPGDAAMYATGPKGQAVAQVQVKSKKRQAVLYTLDTHGEGITVLVDGKNNKVQIAGMGATIEIDKGGDISMIGKSGNGILIQESGVHIKGKLKVAGLLPGFAVMQGPQAGSPGGGAAAPMKAVEGIGGSL